ncbi:galectin-1 [Discoglossus pictus]
MEGVVLNNLNLKQGHCLSLKGLIPKDAKMFSINLGKDPANFCLHFNPRFDSHGDTNTIVCNSKQADAWGAEQRETVFPFKQGEETSICFKHEGDKLNITLPGGQIITFPIRMDADAISFLSLECFEMKAISLE